MLHNGLSNLMIRSTCFGRYYAHHQELATIQMAPACDTSPWLWQVAGLVRGCTFERPGRGMLHESCNIPLPGRLKLQPYTRPVTCLNLGEVPHAGAICIVASSWW